MAVPLPRPARSAPFAAAIRRVGAALVASAGCAVVACAPFAAFGQSSDTSTTNGGITSNAPGTAAAARVGLPSAPSVGGAATPGVGLSGFVPAPADFTHQISPVLGGGAAGGFATGTASGLVVEPRVSLSEAFNDNVFLTRNGQRADTITYLTPGITVSGVSSRLQGTVDYSPTLIQYSQYAKQNSVAQNLNGNLLATVVDGAFYINTRVNAAVTPTLGGLSLSGGGLGLGVPGSGGGGQSAGAGSQGRQNETQTYNGVITPYYVHRFGGIGTFKAGYSLEKSISEGRTGNGLGNNQFGPFGSNQFGNNGPFNNGQFFNTGLNGNNNRLNSNLLTNQETLQFNTGEDLGRIRDQLLLSGSQSDGNGASGGSSQYFVTNDIGYAITRRVTVFAEGGYENINYSSTAQPYRIHDLTYAIGTTLTPKADSSITIGYGHKYGFNSVFLSATYPVTARTRVTARYYTGLGTDLQQIQTSVANSGVDELGNTVDLTTGAPIFLSANGLANNGNNAVYRSKNFSTSATTLLDRDIVSIDVSFTQQEQVATVAGFGNSRLAGNNDSLSTNVTWIHELAPDMQSNINVGYGTQTLGTLTNGQAGNEEFRSFQASLSRTLSPTVTGIAQYTYYSRNSNQTGRGYTQNVLLVGLTKRF